MPRVAKHNPSNDAFFALILGATGSGKTTAVIAALDRLAEQFRRIVVCDPTGQYGATGRVSELSTWLKSRRPRVFRVRAMSNADRRYIGELAWHFGDALLICDEFPMYGNSTEFKDRAWELITNQGRSYGLSVVAIAQRIALIPKTFLNAVTDGAAFRLNTELEQRWVRQHIGAAAAEKLPTLDTHEAFTWGRHSHLFVGE